MGTAIDRRKLRVALAEREMPQWKIAAQLGIAPCAFSRIVCGHTHTPAGFAAQLEEALGLPPGALTT